MTDDQPHGFYADPVDEDGNVTAHITNFRVTSSWAGEIPMIKVPHDEIVLDPENTLRVRIEEDK